MTLLISVEDLWNSKLLRDAGDEEAQMADMEFVEALNMLCLRRLVLTLPKDF